MIRNTVLVFLLMFMAIHHLNYAIAQDGSPKSNVETADIRAAEKLIGLKLTEAERDSMLDGIRENADKYEDIRSVNLSNSVWPAMMFNPIPVGKSFDSEQIPFQIDRPENVRRPANLEDVAFWSIPELAEMTFDPSSGLVLGADTANAAWPLLAARATAARLKVWMRRA